MTQQHLDIAFQIIVFLFAISVHESAHAWMASRCGDPTARMLGRVSLNPLRHIDIFGTIVLPIFLMIVGLPVFGWAKPTPVDPRNFRHQVRDDILTALAGPASNFLLALIALFLLLLIRNAQATSVLMPVALLLFFSIIVNIILMVFNLIPLPPLDGSHVFRHLLSERGRHLYDQVGMVALVALLFLGRDIVGQLSAPVIRAFTAFLR